ncbi:hypothetical protein ACJX0J_014849, partial [Zea mays]
IIHVISEPSRGRIIGGARTNLILGVGYWFARVAIFFLLLVILFSIYLFCHFISIVLSLFRTRIIKNTLFLDYFFNFQSSYFYILFLYPFYFSIFGLNFMHLYTRIVESFCIFSSKTNYFEIK